MDDDCLIKEILFVIFKLMINRFYKNVFYEFINGIFVFIIIIFFVNLNYLYNIELFSKFMKIEMFCMYGY